MLATNRLILAILFFCSFASLQAQNVSFDFASGKLTGELPYDEHFSIELLNLDIGVKEVRLKIYNTSPVHRVIRDLNYPYPVNGIIDRSILDHRFMDAPFVVDFNDFKLNEDGKKRKSSRTVPIKLTPNNSYYFEFESRAKKEISKTEKIAATTQIMQSDAIEDILLALGDIAINTFDTEIEYSDIILEFAPQLWSIANAEIRNINPDYTLELPDDSSLDNLILQASIDQKILKFVGHAGDILNVINYMREDELIAVMDDQMLKDRLYAIIKGDLGSILSSDELQSVDGLSTDEMEDFESLSEDLEGIIIDLDKAKKALVPPMLTQVIGEIIKQNSTMAQTYHLDDAENRKKYVFVDLGYGYGARMSHFSQVAVSIHLRPIKQYIPLKQYSAYDYWANRFSVMAGITLTSQFENTERKGILGENQTVLVGLGMRVVPGLKLNVGAIGYYDRPSPLVDKRNLKANVFFSAAIDFNITPAWKELSEKK